MSLPFLRRDNMHLPGPVGNMRQPGEEHHLRAPVNRVTLNQNGLSIYLPDVVLNHLIHPAPGKYPVLMHQQQAVTVLGRQIEIVDRHYYRYLLPAVQLFYQIEYLHLVADIQE